MQPIKQLQSISKSIQLIEITELKGHEEIDSWHLKELKEEIESNRLLKKAILVDSNTNTILDGHHRLQALKKLGYRKIPVIFVDYKSPEILVQAWRKGETVTKDVIIGAALTGRKLPPKTSKHVIVLNGKLKHVSRIEKEVNLPLKSLR